MAADIRIENYGSIVYLRVLTEAAEVWVNEHIGETNGYQPSWPDVLCEPRYGSPILEGMVAAGLVVC